MMGSRSLLSLLQLASEATSKAAGFVGDMVGAAAGAMGAGIKCPQGMPFCRKAIRRVGRRSLHRLQKV